MRSYSAVLLSSAVGARPVDAVALAWHRRPDELFWRRASCVVIQRRGALVESSGVPGIAKPEPLHIQVMTELVAQRAQKRPERSDLLAHRRAHPHADQHGIRVIVAKQFHGRIFPNA